MRPTVWRSLMADDKQTPSSNKRTPSSELTAKGAMPYVVAALLTSVAMAWYFFLFVPGQLEYFLGSKFRTLAVASGQVQSKIDGLQKALANVKDVGTPADIEKYFGVVVPDLQIVTPQHPAF